MGRHLFVRKYFGTMLLPEFSFEFILTAGLEAERVWSGSVEITYGAVYKGLMIWA